MTSPEQHTPWESAVLLAQAGFSVIRMAEDGTKASWGPWKKWQERARTVAEVVEDVPDTALGIGVVCGAVSGNLELFEFEGRSVESGHPEQFAAVLAQLGREDLWQALLEGWAEDSPSGGLHLFYRVDGQVAGNTKLACRPDPENPAKPLVLIETRGEKGCAVVAPSHGPVHPTGRPWTARAGSGGFESTPTISCEDRDLLHRIALGFDETPKPEPRTEPAPAAERGAKSVGGWEERGGVSVADDYNQRTSWAEILGPAGWTLVFTDPGGVSHWRRPGKSEGTSATTGRNDGDNLYVFSSSTEFEQEKPYSKFAATAVLQFGGDMSACAKALLAGGYGCAPPDGVDPFTDDGNALALAAEHGSCIRYCPDMGRWLLWRGDRWAPEPPGGGAVRELAKHVARQLPGDGTAGKHKKRSLSAAGITNTLLAAQTLPQLVVAASELDARPLELNTPAGIVDLETGAIRAHDPAALHTKITAASPDPEADGERWERFLEETFGGDKDLIRYVQRLAGYSATGVVRDHVLPFAFGGGANGKSVLLETVAGVLGDYATSSPAGFLMAKLHAEHTTDLARLKGMRMVTCSEVDPDARFDEAKVKQLTGGDSITARFMRQDNTTFAPTHKLWLMGNHRPEVRAGGHSFWRRVRLLPFEHTVPEAERVEDLARILRDDHAGAVLRWIVQGAVEYLKAGLADPEAVRAATEEWAEEENSLAGFLAERCRIGGGELVKVKVPVFRDAYEAWCKANGHTPLNKTALTLALKRDHGVIRLKSGSVRLYGNVSLLASREDEE